MTTRDTDARVLLAIVRQPRPTVRSVAAVAGLGVAATHDALVALRALGLVDWTDGRSGTLRATCREVPFGPNR